LMANSRSSDQVRSRLEQTLERLWEFENPLSDEVGVLTHVLHSRDRPESRECSSARMPHHCLP